MLMKENVLVLRKYTLKYCEVKGHDVQETLQLFRTTLCMSVSLCVCGTPLMEMGRGEERMEQTVGKSG